MRHFKSLFANSNAVLVLAFALAMAACVKPQNHDSKVDDAASFYVDEVKPAMDTAETADGFTIPLSRLYTFTACLKDRRTDETLPGAPFVVSGGERDLDLHTDKNGCAVWSEKIAFDYLANEKFLPIERTITAKGSQVGARKLSLAINPWGLSKTAPVMYDLDHHPDLPKAEVANDEQARASLKSELSGSTPRKLFIASLPYKNSSFSTTDGSVARSFKVYLDPSITLTDIDGNQVAVPVGVQSGRLMVTAALIESSTSGGKETKTIVSKTPGVAVSVENGKTSADLKLQVKQGTVGSRYFLAIKVSAVNGPKGLADFNGLFTLGDLKAMTEVGSGTADLKASNADGQFDFDQVVSGAATFQAQSNASAIPTSSSTPESSGPITNNGNGSQVKTFSISMIEPVYSGKLDDVANRRVVKYKMKACVNDMSNGGRPAAGIKFKVQLANKKWSDITASTMNGQEGCLLWEDEITHNYYEPEHWFIIPVTIKHASGYSETRQYAVDPWQFFKFTADPIAQRQWIQESNAQASQLTSVMIADGVEMNTQGQPRYEVDSLMNLTFVKRMGLRIPIRVWRRSNMVDGINTFEGIRAGRYLLKAAYVSPIANVTDRSSRLSISKMIGTNRIVEARGGAIYADIEMPISDLRLLSSRSYLVFEVYLLDEAKLPKNAMSLSGADLMKYVDQSSRLVSPTFAGVVNAKSEKDSSGVLWETAELGENPMNTAASPTARNAIQPLINQTVDKLYAESDRQRDAYLRDMNLQRSMGLVAGRANAEFAFVTNEKYNSTDDVNLQRNNRVLPPPTHAIDALLAKLNTPLTSMGAHTIDGQAALPVTRDTLLAAISGQKGMDPRLAAQLCGYFFYTQPHSKVQGLAWNKVEYGFSGKWANLCIDSIKAGGVESVFSIDHRLRVLETAGVTAAKGRSDLILEMASSLSLSKSNTTSKGWGVGYGTGGITNELSRGLMGAAAGKVVRIFSAVLGGFGVEFSRSSTNSTTGSDMFMLNVANRLAVEQTEVGVAVSKSDECIIIRPKPAFHSGVQASIHLRLLKSVLGDDQADDVMNRGIMLCGGTVNKSRRIVNERYYTMVSLGVGSTMNDQQSAQNLPWLLQLRGQKDLATFMLMASAAKKSSNDLNERVEIGDMPNQYLQQAYDKWFAGRLATMPGFVTLEPKIVLVPRK
jgi:hypothetical protein